LAWLPVLKAETKESVERVVRELRAQARLDEWEPRRRAQGERQPKGADVQQFMAPLETEGRVQYVTKEERARIKAEWVADARRLAEERRQKDIEQRARMMRKAQQQG
jgi:hypothetical protein